jgi:Na+/H+-dicarboxylate symporter
MTTLQQTVARSGRIEQARRRAAGAKRALAVGSAVAFAVTMLLARAAHPGHAAHAQTTSSAVTSTSSNDEVGTVVPQVTTHVS